MVQKRSAPYKVLFCIVDRKITDDVIDLLNNIQEPVHLTCLAEGTRRIGILDMLGVGKIDRSVLLGFVREKMSSEVLKKIDEVLVSDDKSYGWAFTTNLNSISGEALDYIKLKQDASEDLLRAEVAKEATIKMANESKEDNKIADENAEQITNEGKE